MHSETASSVIDMKNLSHSLADYHYQFFQALTGCLSDAKAAPLPLWIENSLSQS